MKEVSVLSPTNRPAEPCAKVFERQRSSAGGEVIYGGQRIVRHGIGQLLGVR